VCSSPLIVTAGHNAVQRATAAAPATAGNNCGSGVGWGLAPTDCVSGVRLPECASDQQLLSRRSAPTLALGGVFLTGNRLLSPFSREVPGQICRGVQLGWAEDSPVSRGPLELDPAEICRNGLRANQLGAT
jgi:hypothetical protein